MLWGYQRGLGSQDCVCWNLGCQVCVCVCVEDRVGGWIKARPVSGPQCASIGVWGSTTVEALTMVSGGRVFFHLGEGWGVRHRGEKAMGKRVATLTTEHAQ